MEEKKNMHDAYKKDGFMHLVLDNNGKKMLLYFEEGMSTGLAFEGVFEFAMYLKELQKKQVMEAMKKKEEEASAE